MLSCCTAARTSAALLLTAHTYMEMCARVVSNNMASTCLADALLLMTHSAGELRLLLALLHLECFADIALDAEVIYWHLEI